MSMYLRVKRKNQTIFLQCEPTDTFGTLKEKVKSIVEKSPHDIKFIHTDKTRELQDTAAVSDFELASDAVIFMVLKVDGGENYEEIEISGYDGKEEASESRK